MKEETFLNIEDLNSLNKEKLLVMRKVLYASVIKNMYKEERKGMYLISLAIFSEFERLTKHILESEIIKN